MEIFQHDYIQLHDLRITINLGVHEWEKHFQQQIAIDLKLFLNLKDCHDKLEHSLCYARISEELRQLFKEKHFELIETVGQKIVEHCLESYPILAVEVIVKKFHMIEDCGHVAIRLLRVKS
jgi:dihydroneopterin aldolase